MSKRILLISLVLSGFVFGITMLFVFWNNQTLNTLRNKFSNTGGSLKDQPIVRCAPRDKKCEDNNEAVKASKLTGQSVEFARHQCDGPKPCPLPDSKTNNEAINEIKKFAKDPTLELIRITGINYLGIIFYCTNDSRCWSFNTKSTKVNYFENAELTPKITPSIKIKN